MWFSFWKCSYKFKLYIHGFTNSFQLLLLQLVIENSDTQNEEGSSSSRRRDPAPPRRRERLHSRDALSAPAPPAASPPRGALSSLRPAAPERCRPPQSRPASPLPPQRSRLSNGGRRASPALAWLTESLSPPNFTSAASLPSSIL